MTWGMRILTYPAMMMLSGSRRHWFEDVFEQYAKQFKRGPRAHWEGGAMRIDRLKPAINALGYDWDPIFGEAMSQVGDGKFIPMDEFVELMMRIYNYESDKQEGMNDDYTNGIASDRMDAVDPRRVWLNPYDRVRAMKGKPPLEPNPKMVKWFGVPFDELEWGLLTDDDVLEGAESVRDESIDQATAREMVSAVNGDDGPDGWRKGVTGRELAGSVVDLT